MTTIMEFETHINLKSYVRDSKAFMFNDYSRRRSHSYQTENAYVEGNYPWFVRLSSITEHVTALSVSICTMSLKAKNASP